MLSYHLHLFSVSGFVYCSNLLTDMYAMLCDSVYERWLQRRQYAMRQTERRGPWRIEYIALLSQYRISRFALHEDLYYVFHKLHCSYWIIEHTMSSTNRTFWDCHNDFVISLVADLRHAHTVAHYRPVFYDVQTKFKWPAPSPSANAHVALPDSQLQMMCTMHGTSLSTANKKWKKKHATKNWNLFSCLESHFIECLTQ